MARNYNSIDLDFTWDGDFLTDHQGDLKDTSENLLLSIQNEIFTIVKSDLEDWREDPSIGTGLGDFIGEPNTIDTGRSIEARVRTALAIIIAPTDLAVRVVPTGTHRVLIIITVQALSTPDNNLKIGDF